MRVAAPPVDGKVNAEVGRFLLEVLNVRRSRVSVVKSATSHDKVLLLQDVGLEEARAKLAVLVG